MHYVYICVYIHGYMDIYVYLYTYMCIDIPKHIYTFICMHTYCYIYTHTHTHTEIKREERGNINKFQPDSILVFKMQVG